MLPNSSSPSFAIEQHSPTLAARISHEHTALSLLPVDPLCAADADRSYVLRRAKMLPSSLRPDQELKMTLVERHETREQVLRLLEAVGRETSDPRWSRISDFCGLASARSRLHSGMKSALAHERAVCADTGDAVSEKGTLEFEEEGYDPSSRAKNKGKGKAKVVPDWLDRVVDAAECHARGRLYQAELAKSSMDAQEKVASWRKHVAPSTQELAGGPPPSQDLRTPMGTPQVPLFIRPSASPEKEAPGEPSVPLQIVDIPMDLEPIEFPPNLFTSTQAGGHRQQQPASTADSAQPVILKPIEPTPSPFFALSSPPASPQRVGSVRSGGPPPPGAAAHVPPSSPPGLPPSTRVGHATRSSQLSHSASHPELSGPRTPVKEARRMPTPPTDGPPARTYNSSRPLKKPRTLPRPASTAVHEVDGDEAPPPSKPRSRLTRSSSGLLFQTPVRHLDLFQVLAESKKKKRKQGGTTKASKSPAKAIFRADQAQAQAQARDPVSEARSGGASAPARDKTPPGDPRRTKTLFSTIQSASPGAPDLDWDRPGSPSPQPPPALLPSRTASSLGPSAPGSGSCWLGHGQNDGSHFGVELSQPFAPEAASVLGATPLRHAGQDAFLGAQSQSQSLRSRASDSFEIERKMSGFLEFMEQDMNFMPRSGSRPDEGVDTDAAV